MIGHIYVYGEISEYAQSSLQNVVNQIQSQAKAESYEVHIHSPGGDVMEGFAIFDALRSTGKQITTKIEGLCASIATVVAMAGDKREMTENSEFLIHNPWGMTIGDSKEVSKYAGELEKIENKLVDFYKRYTNLEEQVIRDYMNNETLFSSAEAKEYGFVDTIITTIKAVAYLKEKEMKKEEVENLIEEKTTGFLDKIKAMFQPKALIELVDASGMILIFPDVEQGVNPQVGDKAVQKDEQGNESPANGAYTMPDGMVYVFDGGVVTEIQEPEQAPDMEALTAENEALRKEIEELRAQAETTEHAHTQALADVQAKFESEVKELKSSIFNEVQIKMGDNSKKKEVEVEPKKRTINIKR